MSKLGQSVSLVAEYLSRHRYIPPERDGWFSEYEIESGMQQDFHHRLRPSRVSGALDYLMEVEPPAVEDTWMISSEDRNPIIEEQYAHPDQPTGARRYYRALGSVTDHVVVEVPTGSFDPAW
jgi:hypothetical protein